MTRTAIRALVAVVALALVPKTGAAQGAVTVSGRVTSGGAPLAGAHVKVDELSPKIDRQTNAEGRYSFIVPSNQVRGQSVTITASLADRRVRHVAKSAVIVLAGSPIVQDFDLERAAGGATDPVPVVPKGAPSTANGPAIVRALPVASDSANFGEIAGAVDLASALAGRVPGLSVSPASTVGGSASLIFRGRRSILGTNQPLYVVDGVVLNNTVYASPAQRFGVGGFDYGSALADLDIADVASVQFLSGPEASAAFGGRAANGVVYVRTKNGGDGPRFGVLASVQSVSESFTDLPALQNQFGQGLNGRFEFFDGKGGGINDNVAQSWGPRLDGQAVSQASYIEAARPDVRLWNARPDNARNYFAQGRTTNVAVGLQGRNELGSFRVYGGNRSTRGITPRDEATRLTAGAHGTVRLSTKLEASANAFATQWKGDNLAGSGFNEGNPVSTFTFMGRQVDTDSLRRHLRDAAGKQISWNYAGHNNPYFAALADSNFARRYHIVAGGAVSYALSSWLTASGRGGVDYFRDHRLFSIASGWMGGFPSYAGPGDFSKGGSEGNEVFTNQSTSSFRLDATKGRPDGARWTVSAGADFYGTNDRIRSLGVDSARHVPSAGAPDTARLPAVVNWSANTRQTAVFGETGVTNADGATLRVGLRNAWLSPSTGQRASSLLPSVRGSVDLVRTIPSLRNNRLLGAATLRAGWWRDAGDLTPYVTQSLYAGRAPVGSIAPVGAALLVPAADLAPELTTGWQVGSDFSLRSHRISVGVVAYGEQTSGVILPVPNTALGTTAATNAGQTSNRGVEGSLGSRLGDYETGLQWDLSISAGRNWNQVDALAGGNNAIAIGPPQLGLTVEARRALPLGVLVGYKQLRDPGTGAPILRAGLPLRDSIRGPVNLGTSQPSATLGFRNALRFRWVTLAVAMDGRVGGSVYSLTNLVGSASGALATTAFRPDSGMLVVGIDAATGGANTTHVSTQDYYHALATIQEPWIYSATYFKVRDARLTVAIPLNYRLAPFQSASVSLVARNMHMWSSAPNIDPETVFSPYQLPGVEMGQLPATKSFGLQVTIAP